MSDGDSKRSFGRGLAREILTIALAMPAALGVLAQLNKRADFLPVFERAVLGHQQLIEFLTQEIEQFLGTEVVDVDALAFCIFLTVQVIVGIMFGKYSRPNRAPIFWIVANVLSISAFAVAFGGTVFTGIDGLAPLIFFVTLFAAFIWGRRAVVVVRNSGSLAPAKIELAASASAMLVAASSAGYFPETYDFVSKNGGSKALTSTLLLVYTLWLSNLIFVHRLRAPAYVMIWILGIYTVGWVSDSLIQMSHRFLDTIGA